MREELEKRLKQLKEEVREIEREIKKQESGYYFIVLKDSKAYVRFQIDNRYEVDFIRKANGNYFKDEENALNVAANITTMFELNKKGLKINKLSEEEMSYEEVEVELDKNKEIKIEVAKITKEDVEKSLKELLDEITKEVEEE